MASLPPWLQTLPSLAQSVSLEQISSLDSEEHGGRCQTYTGSSSSSSSLSSIGSAGAIWSSNPDQDSNPFHYCATYLPEKTMRRQSPSHEQSLSIAELTCHTDVLSSLRATSHGQTVQQHGIRSAGLQRLSRLPPMTSQSVFGHRYSYVSYGPHHEGYGLEDGDDLHIQTLFLVDRQQICFNPTRVESKHSLPAVARALKDNQRATLSRSKQKERKLTTNSPTTLKRASTAHQHELETNGASLPKKQRTNSTDTKEVSTTLASRQESVLTGPALGAKNMALFIPPPKLILFKREHTAKERIARRIATFLSEKDAVMFAKSSMVVYAALDHQWWKSTFPTGQAITPSGQQFASLWPCSNGWCDSCELYHTQVLVHDPSMARLCAACSQSPAFEMVGFNVARGVYRLNRTALGLLRFLPSSKAHKKRAAKVFWPPHLLWLAAYSA